RISEREMCDGDQPAPGVPAEVRDPAIVRATVRARESGVEQLGLPQKAQRGIQHGLGHALAVEKLHALLHVHGAECRAAKVGLLRRGTNPSDLVGRALPPHGPLPELARLVDALAHSSEGAELALTSDGGALAVDLQILEAVIAYADAQGPAAIGGLEVRFPQIWRFENVAVAIDHERFGCHHVLLRPITRAHRPRVD